MKRNMVRSVAMVFALILAGASASRADSWEADKLLSAIDVFHEINRIPDQAVPVNLLADAHGIAIIPGVIKVGFVIGGRHGQGVLSVRNQDGKWSNPCFVSLTGGSVGYQIGAQSTDIVLVFKSRKSVESISYGKFTLGADASVAAGPVGRHAEAGTDVMLKSEIYSYSRNRGLFAGVSIEGAMLQIDHESNAAFYREPYVSPVRVFDDPTVRAPRLAEDFRLILSRYVP